MDYPATTDRLAADTPGGLDGRALPAKALKEGENVIQVPAS
jgi:hypothetical protein